MAILRALPDRALDMEDATHRLTLDLIMQWSYNVDFKGVASFGADAEKIGNGTRDALGTPFFGIKVNLRSLPPAACRQAAILRMCFC